MSLLQYKDRKWWSGVAFWIQEIKEMKIVQRSRELKKNDGKTVNVKRRWASVQVRSSWGYCRSLRRGAGALRRQPEFSGNSEKPPVMTHQCFPLMRKRTKQNPVSRVNNTPESSNATWSGIYPCGPALWWSLNTKATPLPQWLFADFCERQDCCQILCVPVFPKQHRATCKNTDRSIAIWE